MRQGQQNRRGRNRGGSNGGPINNQGSGGGQSNVGHRKPQNGLSRNYESSGPDVKIRGTAVHIAEKYASLARDAMSSGDIVAAENYLQHAEHYNRIIMAAQVQTIPQQHAQTGDNGVPSHNGNRFSHTEPFSRGFDNEADDTEPAEIQVHRPQFLERAPAYHQQPQPYLGQPAYPPNQPQPPMPKINGSGPQPLDLQPTVAETEAEIAKPRRRRRPMIDAVTKTLNGRNGNAGADHAGVSDRSSDPSGKGPDDSTP